jgi:dUTP pyrophosphatase
MTKQRLEIKVLENGKELEMPMYATDGSSGMDIRSAEDVTIYRGDTIMIHTGFSLGIPKGHEVQIRSRSGLAKKHGIFVTNGVGTIDSDYRGEVCVLLSCIGISARKPAELHIKKGDRIAQMVLAPVSRAELVVVAELDSTDRAAGGFGSTGV